MTNTTGRYVNSLFVLIAVALLLMGSIPLHVEGQQKAPPKLVVYGAPAHVFADNGVYSNIAVQIQSQDGKARPATTNLTIALSSSKISTGTVEPILTIPLGQNYAIASFASTVTPGTTTITASAEGFTAGSFIITTQEPVNPLQLKVFLAPKIVAPGANLDIGIQIVDSKNLPVNPPFPVLVTLSSSQIQVGTVDRTMVIPPGNNTAVARFRAGASGITAITASASGFASDISEITVDAKPTIGPEKNKLSLWIVPPQLSAESSSRRVIVVQVLSADNKPVRLSEETPVALSSSNIEAGVPQPSVIIPSGSNFAVANFQTTKVPGKTTITASATDLDSASAILTTIDIRKSPSRLVIIAAPATVAADGGQHTTVVLDLQDSEGKATKPLTPLEVNVFSTNTSVAVVPRTVTILTNESFARVTINSTLNPGKAIVTASASSVTSSFTTLSTVSYPMTVTVISSVLTLKRGEVGIAQAQVMSDGLPLQGAIVKWGANQGVLGVTNQTTTKEGIASTSVTALSDGPITTTASASKKGYSRASGSVIFEKAPASGQFSFDLATSAAGWTFGILPVILVGLWYRSRRKKRRGL